MRNQVKTWNSQQSDIDIFSRLENNFLQKFFKYILTDYFDDYFSNVQESKILKKITDKNTKSLSQDLFISEKMIPLEQLESKIRSFYSEKSKAFSNDDLNVIFQLKHFNRPPDQRIIRQGQFVLVDVKIKADNQKIEEIPLKMEEMVQLYNKKQKFQGEGDKLFHSLMQNYKGQFVNFCIVYYGDANFQNIRKRNFQIQQIQILGKTLKLRVFTFFISKIAMVDTFKTLNKIASLEYINDLVIQFYELKREKQRRKKLRNSQIRAQPNQIDKKINSSDIYSLRNAIFGLGIAVGVSYVIIKKILS